MSAYPSTVLRAARTAFLKEARSTPTGRLLELLAHKETSDGPDEDYVWVGESPRMELHEDELRTEKLSDATYSLVNETWKIGINLHRQDMEDDRVKGLMRKAQGLARVAMGHPERLIVSALEAATTDLCYDGTALFGNSHTDRGGGVQDNLLAGTAVTTAGIQTDMNTAIQTMANFVGENSEPVNGNGLGRLVVVAPWQLRRVFREALEAQVISNTSNVGFSDMEITPYFSNRLTDVDDWYLLHLDGIIKPIIYQERVPVRTEELAEGSDQWVKNELATFSARWRGKVGYGHWANAIKVVN